MFSECAGEKSSKSFLESQGWSFCVQSKFFQPELQVENLIQMLIPLNHLLHIPHKLCKLNHLEGKVWAKQVKGHIILELEGLRGPGSLNDWTYIGSLHDINEIMLHDLPTFAWSLPQRGVSNTEPEDHDCSKSRNSCSSIPHCVEAHMNKMVMDWHLVESPVAYYVFTLHSKAPDHTKSSFSFHGMAFRWVSRTLVPHNLMVTTLGHIVNWP